MALSPEHDKCGGYLNRQVISFALGLIATKCSSPFSGYAGLTRNVVSCHFKFIRTTYHMEGSEIPRVAVSDHPGPQPPPEISHHDCAGVNCTQKSRQRGAQQLGTLRAQRFMRSSGSLFGDVCTERASQLRPALLLLFVATGGSIN